MVSIPLAGAAFAVAVLLMFQWSWWLSFLALGTFVIGYVVSDYFVDSLNGIDFTTLSRNVTNGKSGCRRRDFSTTDGGNVQQAFPCVVCGSSGCDRGRGTVTQACCVDGALSPKIPEVVDDALHEFFDQTVKTFVDSWYEAYISQEDKAFIKQVRSQIQRALHRFYVRLREVDLTHLILDEIVPVAVNHAVVYNEVRQERDQETDDVEELVLERLLSKGMLHPAMHSRSCEMSYLKRLMEYLISKCGDKSFSTATVIFLREVLTFEVVLPAVDVAADPSVVNHLLELFFDPLPMRTYEGELSENVVLLERFADDKNLNMVADTVVFQRKLSEILRDTPVLFEFIAFWKSINAPMNWLQFVMSAFDIQERLQGGQNLTREEISHLHWQSWELYRNYLHEGAPDKLDDDLIPPEIAEGLKLGVEGDPEEAIRRISPVLEQAYQIMYHQIQWRYVVPFCQSARFMEMICATRHNRGFDDSVEHAIDAAIEGHTGDEERPEKGASLSDYVDVIRGNNFDFNLGSSSNSDQGSEEEELMQRPVVLAEEGAIAVLKDLSLWKVSLPRIEPRRDPSTSRTLYVYVVEVEAEDQSRRWTIDRRYREFYILESKLVEFHGEPVLGGFPLPAKKTFNNRSRAFVESQRPIFNQFLKRLLHNPLLSRSELLYAFLTSSNELTASFLPDPFKVMRRVPGKFSRERGQNLSSFLQSLMSSVSKEESSNELKTAESGGRISPYCHSETLAMPLTVIAGSPARKMTLQDKIYGTQYRNNLGLMTRSASVFSGTTDMTCTTESSINHYPITGIYDALLYLTYKLLQIPYITWLFFVSARCLLQSTFNSYVSRFLRQKLSTAMHEQRMATVIHSLRELIFSHDTEKDQSELAQGRRHNAFSLAKLYFDTELGLIKRMIGVDTFDCGLKLLFDGLQCPRLNKQLFYCLLDVAARELFPELL